MLPFYFCFLRQVITRGLYFGRVIVVELTTNARIEIKLVLNVCLGIISGNSKSILILLLITMHADYSVVNVAERIANMVYCIRSLLRTSTCKQEK
jgi:hypothetical protein